MSISKDILNTFGLRHTDTREHIISVFSSKTSALSQADIENLLPSPFDRITVYRTLKTFLDKGVVHKVLDDQGGLKYALCKENCSQGHHHHEHLHFKCTICSQTTCLDNSHIPTMTLPKGFKKNEINILVQGICPNCNIK
jgi:Fur family transcriptional regulator, ferric uptake regulator